MEQVLFSARGLEASWVNSGSFLIADGGSRGRGENKSDEGMAPAERENGIGARTRARASSSRARSENRNNVAISRKTNEAFSKTGAAIGVVTPREKKKKPLRARLRRTDGGEIHSAAIDSFDSTAAAARAHLTIGRGSRIGDARGVAVASRSSRRVHRGRSDTIETRRRNPSSPRRAEGDCGRRRFIELSRFLGERAVGAP